MRPPKRAQARRPLPHIHRASKSPKKLASLTTSVARAGWFGLGVRYEVSQQQTDGHLLAAQALGHVLGLGGRNEGVALPC